MSYQYYSDCLTLFTMIPFQKKDAKIIATELILTSIYTFDNSLRKAHTVIGRKRYMVTTLLHLQAPPTQKEKKESTNMDSKNR